MQTNPSSQTVLVADDDPDLRVLLDQWLSASGFHVLTAANGREALDLVKQHPVEVVITDLKMPVINGLDLLTLLKEIRPDLEVLFLSGQGSMPDVIEALREGRAFDFLLKPLENLGQLNVAIEKALLRKRQHGTRPATGMLVALSNRERQIISLVAEGLENREIATRLYISENTVKNHLARIYGKLKVSNRVQAALTCERMGWI